MPAARTAMLVPAPMPAEPQSRPPSVVWTVLRYWVMGFGLVGHVGGPARVDAYAVMGFGCAGQVGGPGSEAAAGPAKAAALKVAASGAEMRRDLRMTLLWRSGAAGCAVEWDNGRALRSSLAHRRPLPAHPTLCGALHGSPTLSTVGHEA